MPLIAVRSARRWAGGLLGDGSAFQTLADNRDALIAFRDANYLVAVVGFVALYTLIVGFSLPGATLATLTGGFLFRDLSRRHCSTITGATPGRDRDLSGGPRTGIGARMASRLEGSEGLVKRIKAGIDENSGRCCS